MGWPLFTSVPSVLLRALRVKLLGSCAFRRNEFVPFVVYNEAGLQDGDFEEGRRLLLYYLLNLLFLVYF